MWGEGWLSHSFISRHTVLPISVQMNELVWLQHVTDAALVIIWGCHVIKFHQSLCTEINEQAGVSRHYSCHMINVHQSLCRSTSWRARATAAHPAITRGWPWTFTTMQGQRNTSASAPPWEAGARTSPTTSIASSTTSRILTAFNGSS